MAESGKPIAVAIIGAVAVIAAAVIAGIFTLVARSDGGGSSGAPPSTARTAPSTQPSSEAVSSASGPTGVVAERVGPAGSSAFEDYANAAGPSDVHIDSGSRVNVSCRVRGRSFSHDPWWYRIASPPYANRYYAPADNFYNTDDPNASFQNGIFVDEAVPLC